MRCAAARGVPRETTDQVASYIVPHRDARQRRVALYEVHATTARVAGVVLDQHISEHHGALIRLESTTVSTGSVATEDGVSYRACAIQEVRTATEAGTVIYYEAVAHTGCAVLAEDATAAQDRRGPYGLCSTGTTTDGDALEHGDCRLAAGEANNRGRLVTVSVDDGLRAASAAHADWLALEINGTREYSSAHHHDAHFICWRSVDGRLNGCVLRRDLHGLAFVGLAVSVDIGTDSAGNIAGVWCEVSVAIDTSGFGNLATIDTSVLVAVDGGAASGEFAGIELAVEVAVESRGERNVTGIGNAIAVAIRKPAAHNVATVGDIVVVTVRNEPLMDLVDIKSMVVVAIASGGIDSKITHLELRQSGSLALCWVHSAGASHGDGQ